MKYSTHEYGIGETPNQDGYYKDGWSKYVLCMWGGMKANLYGRIVAFWQIKRKTKKQKKKQPIYPLKTWQLIAQIQTTN